MSDGSDFIHLHVHSCYSFLEGVASPAELAQAAAQNGMQALALTDHDGLSGAVEFYDACRDAGVRPLLGLELAVRFSEKALGVGKKLESEVSDARPERSRRIGRRLPSSDFSWQGNLVLLAMDMAGWGGLCRVSSALQSAPKHGPAHELAFERLAQETGGLICLTGGKRGLTAKLLASGSHESAAAHLGQLHELFPGRLYVELQQQVPDDEAIVQSLASLAHRLGLPVVATNNVHYLEQENGRLQHLLTAIRLNRPLSQLPEEATAPPGSHFVTGAEMAQRFDGLREAIASTLEIAERCQLELPLGSKHYPDVLLPAGLTASEALRLKAQAGARQLYGDPIAPQVSSRLEHELAVIGERGYAPLFLIMEEIVQYAHQTGVPISSRGSAASSLVAHCLGITSPDPLRLNLYFERFLNPARSTPPDIDTDLCSRRRDSVIHHVYEKYGSDRVAMICTINRFRRRSALREAAKAHGLPSDQIKAMVETLPYRGWGGPPGSRAADRGSPYDDLASRHPSAQHQKIFRDAAGLIGIPRFLSVHPGGVVITPGQMTDLAPTLLASKGVIITQFDLDSIERMGLVKIDLLGIRGLTVLGDVAEALSATGQGIIQERPSGDPPTSTVLDVLERIPEEDTATAKMVRSGETIGCFQIESPGMRATLKEISAQSVDDIMIALALYRPGPLTGGLKDAFVRRHLGLEPAQHLHPALAPLLGDTHGVILYQEQVLRIAHELAGLSLAEADLLRRAMSHFDPGERMRTLKEAFIAGALARNNVPPEAGERVWDLMAAFAGYGFPKAHAASYAQVAWRAAWCKAHYPAEFMCAVLANWGGYYSQRIYLTEARRLKLALRPPHVNYSRREFSVTYTDGKPALYMGLDQVRDLTRRTQERILHERPFHSLSAFLTRADPRGQEAENLIRTGALDGLGMIPAMLRQLKEGGRLRRQLTLFEAQDNGGEDWSLAEKVAGQEAVLGVSVAAHPLELLAEKIAKAAALTTLEAAGRRGEQVRVAGMRQSWRRTRDTTGDYVYFMSLEDLQGVLEVVISAEVHRRDRSALSTGQGPFVVEGSVELDEATGEPLIRAEKVWRVE